MTIKLKPEHEQFVRQQIEAGKFPDEQAVVDAAISALKDSEDAIPDMPGGVPWTEESLRAAVQVGIDQADRGEFVETSAHEIMQRVRDQLKRERTSKKAS